MNKDEEQSVSPLIAQMMKLEERVKELENEVERLDSDDDDIWSDISSLQEIANNYSERLEKLEKWHQECEDIVNEQPVKDCTQSDDEKPIVQKMMDIMEKNIGYRTEELEKELYEMKLVCELHVREILRLEKDLAHSVKTGRDLSDWCNERNEKVLELEKQLAEKDAEIDKLEWQIKQLGGTVDQFINQLNEKDKLLDQYRSYGCKP